METYTINFQKVVAESSRIHEDNLEVSLQMVQNDSFATSLDGYTDLLNKYIAVTASDIKGEELNLLTGRHMLLDVYVSVSSSKVTLVLSTEFVYDWNVFDYTYLKLAKSVLAEGKLAGNRTVTDAVRVFGPQVEFDLRKGFPLLTTKQISFEAIRDEDHWFDSGSTNTKDLNSKIWNDWAGPDGDCGPIYGTQMTAILDDVILDFDADDNRYVKKEADYKLLGYSTEILELAEGSRKLLARREVDQLQDMIDDLRFNPSSRRILVSCWNPTVLPVSEVFLYGSERYEEYLDKGISKFIENDPKTVDRMIEQLGGEYVIEIRSILESELHGKVSQMDIELGSTNIYEDEDLMDTLGLPTSRKIAPNENPALGRQCLAPCHALFQIGTTEISVEDRLITAISQRLEGNMEPLTVELLEKVMGSKLFEYIDFSVMAGHDSMHIEFKSDNAAIAVGNILDKFEVPRHFADLKLYQRSGDTFLGVPYNIASYALRLTKICEIVNMIPRKFIHTFGDLHVYANHLDQIALQLKQPMKKLPQLKVAKIGATSLSEFDADDFTLDYDGGIYIKGEVAV